MDFPGQLIPYQAQAQQTEDNKRRFLRHLRSNGQLVDTAHDCGMSNRTQRDWRSEDADFARACALQLARYRNHDLPSGNAEQDAKSDIIAYVAHWHSIPLALRFVGWDMLQLQRHLRDDGDFAAEWNLALDSICTQIELTLLDYARFGLPQADKQDEQPERRFDPALALKALHYWRDRAERGGPVVSPCADALAELRQKLVVIRERGAQ